MGSRRTTENFYESGTGDRLVDAGLYPPEIVAYLRAETALVDSHLRDANTLVEVGCMWGRYLEWAVHKRVRYVGIDVVARYVTAGRRRARQMLLGKDACDFALSEAAALPEVCAGRIQPSATLVVFPFNSFGNMRVIGGVVRALRSLGARFLLLSYSTEAPANRARLQYYRNCGYQNVRMIRTPNYVQFVSSEGLWTRAYEPAYLQRRLRATALPTRVQRFGSIGVAYLGHHARRRA